MSASTSVDQASLSLSKTAAIKASEEIIEEELLIKHHDISLINFVDQHIKKFHVGDKEGISISNSVSVTGWPRKLLNQPIIRTAE